MYIKRSMLFVILVIFPLYVCAEKKVTNNIMGPLHVTNWELFEYELNIAKSIGADGITVDVWWGDVEKEDNTFVWDYYKKVFKYIKNANLKIIPIMSFHKCGNTVGDDYLSNIPKWVVAKYKGEVISKLNYTLLEKDFYFVSETKNVNDEYFSLWVDNIIWKEYYDFMRDFEDNFSNYSEIITEINISCGPGGELRYPSYGTHDADKKFGIYPDKGYLQCYSNIAIKDYQYDMLQVYGSIEKINTSWKTNYSKISDVLPPAYIEDGNNSFFYPENNPYNYLSQQGQAFIKWYNQKLVKHGSFMLDTSNKAFIKAFKDIPLGIKIAGVHWQMKNTSSERAAEINAGLISGDFTKENEYGYSEFFNMLETLNFPIILHFTCLEMDDDKDEGSSSPKLLVKWMGEIAQKRGIDIRGENAVSLKGKNDKPSFWNNINDAIRKYNYSGITILRLKDCVHTDFKQMIKNQYYTDSTDILFMVHGVDSDDSVYITGNHELLGKWEINKAIKMDNSLYYPSWSVVIEGLKFDDNLEFKFFTLGESDINPVWETDGGVNRKYNLNDYDNRYEGLWGLIEEND